MARCIRGFHGGCFWGTLGEDTDAAADVDSEVSGSELITTSFDGASGLGNLEGMTEEHFNDWR